MTPDSIQSAEHDTAESYSDGGQLLCGDCGGSCLTHTWDRRQQAWIGECCQFPQSDPLPANYAAQQLALLEEVVGLGERHPVILEALAHLRMAKMQSSGPLVHVEIAERLLRKLVA
jgi:hypothetical protein